MALGKTVWNARLEDVKRRPLGTLVIISEEPHQRQSQWYVKTVCSACKTEREIRLIVLWSGYTKGCLCGQIKYSDVRSRTLRNRYALIRSRCIHSHDQAWSNYGGRGIELRFSSPKEFVDYILLNLPHPTYQNIQIDRINNNGHYEPGNLRLATRVEQCRNKRTNVWVDYKNSKLIATVAARRLLDEFPGTTLRFGCVYKLLCKNVPWHEIVDRKGNKK